MIQRSIATLALAALAACGATTDVRPERAGQRDGARAAERAPAATPPLPGLEPVDHLIQPGEARFAHLWRVTRGGENAEGYWSFAGDRLALQRRAGDMRCDRIFVTDARTGALVPVSNGRGATTCAFFLPGDREVVFASTQSFHDQCPPPPDLSQGYAWALRPEFDLWAHDLASGAERRITETWGYDAEATVSPRGDRMVFTSTRSGDPELYTCALDGSDVVQVTDELGYDGGAFFSHDGERLVFRSTRFAPDGQLGDRAQYRELMREHMVRPHAMELFVVDVDGSNRRQVTDFDGASFAPYFMPDDARIVFSTNFADPAGRDFDLYLVGDDGEGLERVTTYAGFDSFPMPSRDGRFLVFASNRGGTEAGETNLYVAEWVADDPRP